LIKISFSTSPEVEEKKILEILGNWPFGVEITQDAGLHTMPSSIHGSAHGRLMFTLSS
jgi:hypothetical protein